MILWQVGIVGGSRTAAEVRRPGLQILAERLAELYGADHEVIVYEATPFPIGRPLIERAAVRDLHEAGVTGLSSLFVPAGGEASRDPDMVSRLEMAP
jgi:hypothetical protein